MESRSIKEVSSSESLEAAGPWLHSDLGMLPLRPSREPVLTEVTLFMILCYGSPGKSTSPPSNSLQVWLKIRKVLKMVQAGACRDGTRKREKRRFTSGLWPWADSWPQQAGILCTVCVEAASESLCWKASSHAPTAPVPVHCELDLTSFIVSHFSGKACR